MIYICPFSNLHPFQIDPKDDIQASRFTPGKLGRFSAKISQFSFT